MIFVSFDQVENQERSLLAKEKEDSIFRVLTSMKIKQIQYMEFTIGQEF
jgi:nitrate/nitrite-specific signal transduction histidine kinase